MTQVIKQLKTTTILSKNLFFFRQLFKKIILVFSLDAHIFYNQTAYIHKGSIVLQKRIKAVFINESELVPTTKIHEIVELQGSNFHLYYKRTSSKKLFKHLASFVLLN